MTETSQTALNKTPKQVRGIAKAAPIGITIGILILAYIIGGVVLYSAFPYRRYVSPPLSDGRRYTFLYPQRLRYVHELRPSKNTHTLEQAVTINNLRTPSVNSSADLSVSDLLSDWMTTVFQPGGKHSQSEIIVGVSPMAPDQKGQVRDTRKEEKGKVAGPFASFQSIIVEDAGSGRKINVIYSHEVDDAMFARDSAMLSRSFRVLAPGEAPPQTGIWDKQ